MFHVDIPFVWQSAMCDKKILGTLCVSLFFDSWFYRRELVFPAPFFGGLPLLASDKNCI